MKKLGFPESPDFLPAPTRQPTREQIQAFQDASAAVSAKNKKHALDANARWERHQKKQQDAIDTKPDSQLNGCVFAKSCNLPDGVINHQNSTGFVPLERLADYGLWAVLGTGAAITAEGIPLKWVAGSATGGALAQRLGGSLALALIGSVAAGTALGTVTLLMPNTSLSPDSAFYKKEQYAELDAGRTRVRINVKTLPDGSVSAYGFYTGGKKDWEFVPVIQATKQGEKFVADIGNGIGLTWTPAANPDDVPGIPALEGAPPLPTIWVYPPTEQANKILVNPEHPPEYQDAIIWFPADAGLEPIYIVLSARYDSGVVTGVGEDVSGVWLAGAGTGLGAPIPTRIADQLRGQTFRDFDAFRAAFWLEVSNDAVLRDQFCLDNQRKISQGKAPIAIESEHAGDRMRFEIHHIEHIKNGGEVYNVDNLSVMTPTLHIQTHNESK
ncbi:S-type pyocin domain-containing protein [Pseudomonas sp. MPC6]|uniref:S-type pyocin domain-containing protein n=1 Tax=unclassified Pseudomonas TaxID=196821 RepID=UPI001110BAB5|nr:S-type pyocin domain-containing protein [Pseudomonas sp. MPC6]QCY14668.1 pyocin [Pseudomonas sp. MPC6]